MNNLEWIADLDGGKVQILCACGYQFVGERRHLGENSTQTDCGCGMTGIRPGDIFGTWVVGDRVAHDNLWDRRKVNLKCPCGAERVYSMKNLAEGKYYVCECYRGHQHIGERYERLVIVRPTYLRSAGRGILFEALCDCGQRILATRSNMVRGNITSCGCRARELSRQRGLNGIKGKKSKAVGYFQAHVQVSEAYGLASTHKCAMCKTEQASSWCYDHLDPEEVISTKSQKGLVFSRNIDHYVAMCRSCHVAYDLAHKRGEPLARPVTNYKKISE